MIAILISMNNERLSNLIVLCTIHFRDITKMILFYNPFMVPGIMQGIIVGTIFPPYTIM